MNLFRRNIPRVTVHGDSVVLLPLEVIPDEYDYHSTQILSVTIFVNGCIEEDFYVYGFIEVCGSGRVAPTYLETTEYVIP